MFAIKTSDGKALAIFKTNKHKVNKKLTRICRAAYNFI